MFESFRQKIGLIFCKHSCRPVRVPARVVCFHWCVFYIKSACDTRSDNSNLLGDGPGGDNDGGSDGVGVVGDGDCDGVGGGFVSSVIVVVMVVVMVIVLVVLMGVVMVVLVVVVMMVLGVLVVVVLVVW